MEAGLDLLSELVRERLGYVRLLGASLKKRSGSLEISRLAACRKSVLKILLESLPQSMETVAGWSCSDIARAEMISSASPLNEFLETTSLNCAADYRKLTEILRLIQCPFVWAQIARLVLLHPVPTTVNDRYVLQKAIFEEKIYRALDIVTGVPYAVKLQDTEEPDDMVDEYLATHGASVAGRGFFPQLVAAGTALIPGVEVGHPIFAMVLELCHCDLITRTRAPRDSGSIPREPVQSLIGSLLQGLHYLHTQVGLVHCDIKLDNIMYTSRGTPCFIDLGLAVPVGDKMQGKYLYTDGYKPPEVQVSLRKRIIVRPSMDVFALGVTIIQYLVPCSCWIFSSSRTQDYVRGFKKLAEALAVVASMYGTQLASLLQSMVAYEAQARPTVTELLQSPLFGEASRLSGCAGGFSGGFASCCCTNGSLSPGEGTPWREYRHCSRCWEVARPFISLSRPMLSLVKAVAPYDRAAFADVSGFLQGPLVLGYAAMLHYRTARAPLGIAMHSSTSTSTLTSTHTPSHTPMCTPICTPMHTYTSEVDSARDISRDTSAHEGREEREETRERSHSIRRSDEGSDRESDVESDSGSERESNEESDGESDGSQCENDMFAWEKETDNNSESWEGSSPE